MATEVMAENVKDNRKHGVASSLSRFSQVFFFSSGKLLPVQGHCVWWGCGDTRGWFQVWNDVTVPVRTCWSWCCIKENLLQNDCQMNPVQGNIMVCMYMYHLNIHVAACIPIPVCIKGGRGPSHDDTVSFQDTPCGGKKVSSSHCINLQLSLRLPRRIPGANCVYAGFNTIQLASGAQPDRNDSCKSSSNS